MKSDSMNRCVDSPLFGLVIAGAVLMVSSASVYAQTMSEPATHQLTRAEVMHELEELEAAGYNPSQGDDGSYPADLQAAEEKSRRQRVPSLVTPDRRRFATHRVASSQTDGR